MMDLTSNTFARRAKLSTAYIALAIAVTVAATAVLYSSSAPDTLDVKVESPITSTSTTR